jgi:hypothetical protein
MENRGGWERYQELVLSELKGLKAEIKDLRDICFKLHTDITILKSKAVAWGAVAGFVSSAAIELYLRTKG